MHLVRGSLLVLLVGLQVWVGGVPASAHQSATGLTPVIDGFTPAVEGVAVAVQASQDATLLTIEPAAGVEVEVLDADGRPWVRVTATTVEADLTSPAFHAGASPNGVVPEPLPGPDGDPWVVVGRDGRFQWFEHRLHPDGLEVDAEVLASDVAQDVSAWAVPLRVDGREVALEGRLRHVPVTGRVEPRLTSPRQLAPGVVVEVAAGPVPAFFLRNEGEVPVTVLSRDGAPYVVVDEAGAAVNVASATWVEQRRFDGAADPVRDGPQFEQVSATPSHSWLDARASLPGVLPSPQVRSAGREVVLREWSIPVQVGNELHAIEGASVWVPLPARDTTSTSLLGADQLQYAVAVGVAMVLVGVRLWRRRAGT